VELELVCSTPDGNAAPVLVSVPEQALVGDLRRALQAHLGSTGGGLYAGFTLLPDSVPVAAAGLVHGAAVGLGQPVWPAMATDAPMVASGERELAVVGGLYCGPAKPVLPRAVLRLGRSADADLVLADPEVSRDHARVSMTDAGLVRIADTGSRNGIRRRGWRLAGEAGEAGQAEVGVGDVLGLGESVVGLRERIVADADVSADSDAGGPANVDASGLVKLNGGLRFNRPPRILPPRPATELLVPVPPTEPKGFRFPWITVLIPLLLGGLMYLVFPNAGYFLIIMLFSPLMILANLIGDRRSGRKEYAANRKTYDAELARFTAALAAAAVTEEQAARSAQPDPSALVALACGPSARLWERRYHDPDFLVSRVGLIDRPAAVSLRPDPKGPPGGFGGGHVELPAPPTVYDVPATVDLAQVGVLGVASADRQALLATARAIVAQAATLHAPGDLGIVVIIGLDGAPDWEWASWLPHTRPTTDAAGYRRALATDGEQAEARLVELRALVEARMAERRSTLRAGPGTGRATLLVLDGARRLRGLPGLGELLATGPEAGIYALCLDAEQTALPDECRATLVTTSPSGTRATLRRPGLPPVPDVLVDGLMPGPAGRLARALAPLRALGVSGGEAALPDAVRFTELAALPLTGDPEADAQLAARRWAASPNGRCTKALLGVGPNGPLTVDLRADGPHALVAGTSGAGKSELLQTLVASLALVNTPDALTFVLVDYKGGSAFAACAQLPHCVGMVTDLDGHLVTRVLDSLSAELRRREALLAQAEAKDIDDYWARTGARLPRLVIVVDEFASLVEEVPEFVPGVVGIGMRGRSLGVHVVLATQRPGGVVTADMRANVNLRICLRVTAEAESQDVVDSPDAARITPRRPGRAFVRTGHADLTCFQAARVGWPRRSEQPASRSAIDPVTIRPRLVAELGRQTEAATARSDDVDTDGCTDLSLLVAATTVAARRAGLDRPRRPWLPPLPDLVTVAELPASRPGSPVSLPLGLVDRPDAQSQDAFEIDLEATGPIAIAGGVRTGRSTALRTMAAGLSVGAGPDSVHIYALDCGNRALAPLAALPHSGAVIDGDDSLRLTRLLDWLDAEVRQRQRVLAAGNYGSLAEQRTVTSQTPSADRLPYLVLLLDRLEAFLGRYADIDGGRLVDMVEGLLRRGPAVGLVTVLTTDRTGFTHRIAAAVEHRLVLRQADGDDAAAFGLSPKRLPSRMPAGRGVWAATGQEIQVALLDPDPSGSAQSRATERLAASLRVRWDGMTGTALPRRIDPLPDHVTAQQAAALRTAPRVMAPAVCTPGVGGDHLGPIDLDLAAAGATFIVAGPPRSGRSTALAAIAESLGGRASRELELVLLTPRPSLVRALRGLPGVLDVITTDDQTGALTRLEDLLAEASQPTVLVIDDGELIGLGPLADRLEEYVRGCRDTGSVLVAAVTTEDLLLNRYRGWLAAARRARSGLLLNPASYVDGEVFEVRLPRSIGGGWPPGRALLVERGAARMVQVPAFMEVHGVQP
jgi:DNA segregation ATPase FtsK/SpoIIIE, S-DNA-T family